MMELLASLNWHSLVALGLGLLLAGVVKGATGLGYSSCALPFLVHALGLKNGIALVLFPAMATNVAVALGNGHLRTTCRDFAALYLAMLPGVAAGIWLLGLVDQHLAVKTLGISIIAYVVFSLARPQLRLGAKQASVLQVPVGLTNGILTGLTGSQVMPMVPYFLAHDLEPARVVQAINLGVLMASAALAAGLSASGVIDHTRIAVSIIAIVPALAGVEIGRRLQHRIQPTKLKTLILIVLAIAGAGLVLR